MQLIHLHETNLKTVKRYITMTQQFKHLYKINFVKIRIFLILYDNIFVCKSKFKWNKKQNKLFSDISFI